MIALFDSSVLIAHLRGVDAATALLSHHAREGTAMGSVLPRTKLEGGMRSAQRAPVARLFEAVRLVPVSDAIAVRAGAQLRRYRRAHAAIDIVDHVIAATAEELNAELLTLNVRHFPMLRGLRPAF